MARKNPNNPNKEEVDEEPYIDYDDTFTPSEDEKEKHDNHMYSKDRKKSKSLETKKESQDSGV